MLTSEYRSNVCLLLHASHDLSEVHHGMRELTKDLNKPDRGIVVAP